MNKMSFNDDSEFDETRIKTKVIIETSFSKEIRILLKSGQLMKEHKTPFPILLHLLEGNIELSVQGEIHLMNSGDIIALEGNISHSLTAIDNSIVRLTLSKYDKVERVEAVLDDKANAQFSKKQMENRDDILMLVNCFYSKIRTDELLGPIFNNHISEDKWKEHIDRLTDFWETNLFGVAKFKGSPTQKHINLDKSLNYGIEQQHFGKWLQLWFETIDELFIGENADKAKNAARKMSTGQFLAIWTNRPQNNVEE